MKQGDICPECDENRVESVSTSGGGLVGWLCIHCNKFYPIKPLNIGQSYLDEQSKKLKED